MSLSAADVSVECQHEVFPSRVYAKTKEVIRQFSVAVIWTATGYSRSLTHNIMQQSSRDPQQEHIHAPISQHFIQFTDSVTVLVGSFMLNGTNRTAYFRRCIGHKVCFSLIVVTTVSKFCFAEYFGRNV
jgi:hypothetical protein